MLKAIFDKDRHGASVCYALRNLCEHGLSLTTSVTCSTPTLVDRVCSKEALFAR